MSHRIESPESGAAAATSGSACECLAAATDAPATLPTRRTALTTAAGLVSVTASAWRVRLATASVEVPAQRMVRRVGSRGPRR